MLTYIGGKLVSVCCCTSACIDCAAFPSAMKIAFSANENINGSGCDCDGFVATFTLLPLNSARMNYLVTTYPSTFPGGSPTDVGCWYGIIVGGGDTIAIGGSLACGANFMSIELTGSGTSGAAHFTWTIGWADGTFVRLNFTNPVSPSTNDCIANLSFNAGSPGVAIGYESGGSPPCDFLELHYEANWGDVTVTAES